MPVFAALTNVFQSHNLAATIVEVVGLFAVVIVVLGPEVFHAVLRGVGFPTLCGPALAQTFLGGLVAVEHFLAQLVAPVVTVAMNDTLVPVIAMSAVTGFVAV